ncbi:MAG: hypothetical protein H0U16_02800 [Actinobacteria bacterium]|nr:hypothetical protein [Actinomycetota bacterium]
MDRVVIEDMIPALEQEPGFQGGMNLVNGDDGNGMMIMPWETREQAEQPLSDYGPAFLQSLAKFAAISSGDRAPILVWEVNAKV